MHSAAEYFYAKFIDTSSLDENEYKDETTMMYAVIEDAQHAEIDQGTSSDESE